MSTMKFKHTDVEGRVTMVKADAVTTHEALDLWVDFMRGISFIIDHKAQEALHEALDSQTEGFLSDHEAGYDDDMDYADASPTDSAEAQAEQVGERDSYPCGPCGVEKY